LAVLVLACLFFGIGTQAAAFFKAEGAGSADTAETAKSKPDVVLDRGREKTEAGTSQSRGRPNVILILADDLDKSVFSRTTLDSAWVTEGASFSNALATTSLCCPSRASILKGQHAHNTGLVNNDTLSGAEARSTSARRALTGAPWPHFLRAKATRRGSAVNT
jgi:hypothetical protein